MLLVALIGFAPALYNSKEGEINNSIIILAFIMIFPLIWMVALVYNAFTTSLNLKGTKAVAGFIAGLIVAEALAFILNQMIL